MSAEWISVADRLPTADETVIVANLYKWSNKPWTYWVATARFERERFQTSSGVYTNVTHWMPMPEPPEIPKEMEALP